MQFIYTREKGHLSSVFRNLLFQAIRIAAAAYAAAVEKINFVSLSFAFCGRVNRIQPSRQYIIIHACVVDRSQSVHNKCLLFGSVMKIITAG